MIPKNRLPNHPGQMLLKEFLEPAGITQKSFASQLGWTYATIRCTHFTAPKTNPPIEFEISAARVA
jgi:hypothetical protein